MMNINIQIADGARFFDTISGIVVVSKEEVERCYLSKFYADTLLTELAEIHSAIERQESISFFSGALKVSQKEPQ